MHTIGFDWVGNSIIFIKWKSIGIQNTSVGGDWRYATCAQHCKPWLYPPISYLRDGHNSVSIGTDEGEYSNGKYINLHDLRKTTRHVSQQNAEPPLASVALASIARGPPPRSRAERVSGQQARQPEKR